MDTDQAQKNRYAQIELQDTAYQDRQTHSSQRPQGEINEPSVKATIPPEIQEKSPKQAKKVSFLSLLHFFFAVKLVRFINSLKGQKLSQEILEPVMPCQTTQELEALFTKNYYDLKPKYAGKPQLMALILLRIFKKDVIIQIIWQLLYAASGILTPYFLYLTLDSLNTPDEPIGNAYAAAVGVFICFIIGLYSTHQIGYNSIFAVNRMKLGILAMLFRKVNHISLLALQQFSLGKMINIGATDTDNLEGIHYVISLAIAPLALGGGIGLLCYFWGPSCFAGVGYMAIVAVLQDRIAWRSPPFGAKRDFNVDERMRKTNEALEIIRVIKLETWESSIFNNITKLRHLEASGLKKFFSVFFISRALVSSAPYIAAFLIFVTHNETEEEVPSDKIFPTILLLNCLGTIVMMYAYLGSLQIILMRGLFLRTISIMDLPEAQPLQKPIPPLASENSVEFRDFTGFWTKKDVEIPNFIKEVPHPVPSKGDYVSDIPAISNLNLNIKKGDLVIVAGQVASGKSSLLLSFTREMAKTSGELRYSGKFDYVPQNPIFLANSIRETVTFGKPYDEELFWKVVEACCLTEMIQNLPKKEFTQVAERGANLSGTQKLQFALARSLYTQADIYLLDDPLSSLDSHLSKQVFNRAIQGFLKDATVILVTNHLNFVKHANHIVMMEAGKIVAQGTYSDLARENIVSELAVELKDRASYEKKRIQEYGSGRQSSDVFIVPVAQENKEKSVDETTHLQLTKKDDGLFSDEEKLDDGNPTMKIYWLYFRSIFKWWNIIPLIILFAGCEAVGWQFMIRTSDWIEGDYSDSLAYGILAAIAFGNLILQFVKCVLFYCSGISGVTRFHDTMLKSVLQSPLKFFDRNGIGRILNRFANDLYMMDRFLLNSLQDILEGLCLFLINLIAVWVEEPYILIPVAVASVFFVLIFLWCRKTIRQTRELDLATKSPIYAQFSVVITGLTVLRAPDLTESVMRGFYKRADEHSKCNVAYQASIRLMSFLMDYVTELTVIASFCIIIRNKENPTVWGPFINMLVMLPSTMQWILKHFVIFYGLMTSPARVINYCENAQRVDLVRGVDNKYTKEGWPQKGEIDIHNASLRYRDQGDLVIKHLSAHFKSGEKVAILGHSGSGMTSFLRLMIRAFNLADKSTEKSYIKIDNVDIDDVGAHLLRKGMTVISQDYFLFTGTLRENMDPWKLYTDEEIWSALDTAELKHFVEQLDKKLDTFYIGGSSLFSVGQKQLFNIARFVLRKSKILIQDRATSHVDIITDQHVQEKLKKRYQHATNLTTTTRHWNIADFDKVLSMVDGEKKEFDEPYRLLVKEIGDQEITNKQGYFAGLVIDMNPKITEEVFRIAKKKYYQTHDILSRDISLDRSIPNERLEAEGEGKDEAEQIMPPVIITDQVKTSDITRNRKPKLKFIEHLMLHELLPHVLQKLRPAHLQAAHHDETD